MLTIALWMALAAQAPPVQDIEVVFDTEAGSFRMELYPDKAPKHVAFFLDLVKKGYYNGSGFHRVYANALVQGGDPLLKDPKTPKTLYGTGGLKLQKAEFSDLKHERGIVSTVSIPNTPDSDGAQFFICLAPQPSLDGKYSSFGKVTEGFDVLARISQIPANAEGLAEKPLRITATRIEPKKVEPFLKATAEQMKKTVRIETTLGVIRAEVHPEWGLETVRNFLKLVESGWYNGQGFHRIAKGFVVQGGSEGYRNGEQAHAADRWVRSIPGEFSSDVKHVRGILSMARGEDPNSASTSFFFVLATSPHLDKQYAAFGRIVEGLEVLEAFEKEEVDGETPKRRLEILKATIE
jgi:cyclophilin family peptidyl-prolyl cis-trans isomerase